MKSELKGQIYNAIDPEMNKIRSEVQNKVTKMNNETNRENKQKLIKEIFGEVGVEPMLNPFFRCEYGKNITVGDYFFANYNCIILDSAKVTIGNNVLFGPQVGIYTGNHLLDPFERAAGGTISKPVSIGDNCWIGANALVLSGVSIGNNTVIGAGSVVTKDIPGNVIAFGNPCKVIRYITDDDKVNFSVSNKN